MTIEQLTEFIDWTLYSKSWQWSYQRDDDHKVRVLSQALKISEEVWELSSEILWYLHLVRKEKQDNYSQETLESELADVIISTCRLARYLDINIDQLLTNRIEKLKDRVK